MKRLKAVLIIIMLVCMFTNTMIAEAGAGKNIAPSGGNLVAANDSYGPVIIVDPKELKPLLNVVPGTTIPVFNAGSTVTLTLPIKNNSSNDAKDVIVTLEAGGKSEFPFEIDELNLSKKIDKLNAYQTKDLTFELNVNEYAAEGRYTLKLNYTYSNYNAGSYTSSEQIAVKIVNKNTSPKLAVSKITLNPEIVNPGQKVNLSAKISNMGTLNAKDVKVTLLGLKNDEFTTSNFTDVKYINEINGQSETYVGYTLIAAKNITGGNHSLEIKMEYKDSKNTAYTEVNQIFIPVVGKASEGKPSVALENIEYPVGTIKSGNDFSIAFNVVNKGNGKADNIKVWLSNDKEIIAKSLSTISIESLEKGQAKKVSFNMGTLSDASTKNYPIAINLEYDEVQTDKTVRNSLSQYVGVYIENETSNKSVPKIIVDRYNFEPADIKAGQNFKLKVSFQNTNRTTPVSNIKVSVSSDDGTFTPVKSSNTFFIESIAPKSSVEKVLEFNAKPDAAPKLYALSVNFEYEDSKGTQYTAKDVISIPVQQLAKLVTGEIIVPPEAYAGQPVSINTEFFNMGKAMLYNLMIKAQGDFTVQGSGYYVGNFDVGKSDSFDCTVIPKAAGTMKGNVIFAYEDVSGKVTEIKKEFTMNVMDMPAPEAMNPEGMKPPEEVKKPFNKTILIAGGAVLAAIIAIIAVFVIRRKIKVRKELTLDE